VLPGPPLQVQPVPPSMPLLATQRPVVVSQCWLDEQPAHVAPDIPHWLMVWLA